MKPPETLGSAAPVVLVTGATGGLGEKISLCFAKDGYSVVVNYLNSSDRAKSLSEQAGSGSVAIRADVGDSDQVAAMLDRIENVFGRLDVVINNAGIGRDRILLRQSEEDWDEIIKTNLKGCFNVIRFAAPLLIKAGGGHIINVSSYSGSRGKAGQAAYSASKSAIIGLTYVAAAELAPHGIKVNALSPGYLDAGMGIEAPAAMNEAKIASLLGSLSDAGTAAEFLLNLARTNTITGQVFNLDSRIG